MECSHLRGFLNRLKGDFIPFEQREPLEQHLRECRHCQAAITSFLKIDRILERTVYGASLGDKHLTFLGHAAGRKLRWENAIEAAARQRDRQRRRLGWLLAGVLAAALAGGSSVFLLGRLGMIGPGRPSPAAAISASAGVPASPAAAPAPVPPPADTSSAADNSPPADSARLQAIYQRLEQSARPEPGDSARLRTLEAELGAYRDALSRTPGDPGLTERARESWRGLIEERRRLGRPARVRDYYGLGYLHYRQGQYPQTAVVTAEGLQLVRMDPGQYLHYLKAMSHYQLARRALQPLPADTTHDEQARLQGTILRAQLDREAKRRAALELRRSIAEFSHLLDNPELEGTAREWLLKCNDLLAGLDGQE